MIKPNHKFRIGINPEIKRLKDTIRKRKRVKKCAFEPYTFEEKRRYE